MAGAGSVVQSAHDEPVFARCAQLPRSPPNPIEKESFAHREGRGMG